MWVEPRCLQGVLITQNGLACSRGEGAFGLITRTTHVFFTFYPPPITHYMPKVFEWTKIRAQKSPGTIACSAIVPDSASCLIPAPFKAFPDMEFTRQTPIGSRVRRPDHDSLRATTHLTCNSQVHSRSNPLVSCCYLSRGRTRVSRRVKDHQGPRPAGRSWFARTDPSFIRLQYRTVAVLRTISTA